MIQQTTFPRTIVTSDNALRAGACISCGSNTASPYLQAPDRYHGRVALYRLVRCESCSLVWLENAPPPKDIGLHYGPDYDRSVKAAGEEPNRWRGRCQVLSRHKSGGSILDLGCSAGGFLAGLKSSSWRLHGIEMSDVAAKEAQSRTGAQVFVGDILDAPFPPHSFDAITCFHVLEHLYHPHKVLAKVADWLKPGGIFYMMVPNIDSAGARIFRSYWYALELPRHLFHFSPRSLGRLAESVDLETVSLTTHHEVFIESSTRYILDAMIRKVGINRTPLAKASGPNLPVKVLRKAFRLTALPILNGLASLAGPGESIHAIFRKRSNW